MKYGIEEEAESMDMACHRPMVATHSLPSFFLETNIYISGHIYVYLKINGVIECSKKEKKKQKWLGITAAQARNPFVPGTYIHQV